MIEAIYISKVRNGIIGKPPKVEVAAGKGILGDRYFEDSNRKSRDYEITFIEAEDNATSIQVVCRSRWVKSRDSGGGNDKNRGQDYGRAISEDG